MGLNNKKKGGKVKKDSKPGHFAFLNPKNLVKEINRYGYHFTLIGFWKFYLISLLGVLITALVYKLQPIYILIVVIFTLLLTPAIIGMVYKNLYEQKRFLDVTNYLEQLLYSYRKKPKLLAALRDTLLIFQEGRMHDLITLSIDNIQNRPIKEGEGMYQSIFFEIEDEYKCRRMKQAHEFIIKAENQGGDFNKAIDILLEDRRLWIERVYEMQQERKNLKIKIIVSLFLSFVICGMAMFMIPTDFDTLNNPISQISTTLLIISNILIYYIAEKKLSASWLDDMQENIEEIKRYYDNIVNFNKRKERKKSIVMAACCSTLCLMGISFNSVPTIVCGIIAVFFALMQPNTKLKIARKHTMREIEKAFPVWTMELALLLQTDNPHVALMKSVQKAPFILKADLQKLVEDIETDPTSVEPYLNFMPDFDLPDIQSVLRMVYSMSESGVEDADQQIMFLVERNNRLLDKAERMSNEDKISGIALLILVPMLTGSLKMMVDLGMFLISLLGMAQSM